jgi:4-diphosphocytidyl-2-C-methyl-D-erythritol kinase
MTALRDTAKAKLNLTLEVLGRRADFYHEVRSLVGFTDLGDSVALEPGDELALAVDGPFAGALEGDNLIIAAAEATKSEAPGIALGRFELTKALPVAAGLGGGSADAAAALRLLAEANPETLSATALVEIAGRLGSDVTACLASRPALMIGRGEHVADVRGFPGCGVVLVNPGLPLATASVYGALKAAPLSARTSDAEPAPDFGGSFERLIDYASPRGNDLAAAALRLAPAIGEVLTALRHLPGARLVQLAGSGPTCFALFATAGEAEDAAASLQAAHPSWWVAATSLGAS